jgi:hypothetical protein
LADQRAERLAVDELHGVEVDAALAAHEVDRHDVGVVQARRRLRLVLEAAQLPRVHGGGEGQHLQGHPPPQGHLLRLEHHPHAAPAHFTDYLEIAKPSRLIGGQIGRAAADRLRQSHQLQRRQHLPQQLRRLRMAGGVFLDVRTLAVLQSLQELVGHAGDQRLQRYALMQRCLAHGGYSSRPCSPRTVCSRINARP